MVDLAGINGGDMNSQEEKRTRQVSRYAFPYYDLDASIEVAVTLHERAGGKASHIQLASYLGHKDEFSGAYRAKLWGAQMFGLAGIKGTEVWVTPLGEQLASTRAGLQRDRRLAEAFLNVPLFREVYRRYESSTMPATREGLKRALEGTFGVSPRRVSTAVKTLLASAEEAGFLRQGPNRLVHPVPVGLIEEGTPHEVEPSEEAQEDASPKAVLEPQLLRLETVHPAIEGFLWALPKGERQWSDNERQRWLDAFNAMVKALYPSDKEAKEVL